MSSYEEQPEELNRSAARGVSEGNSAARRSPELNSFEAALAELTPRAVSLDRDRLMYLAGQASVGAGRSGIRENSERNPPPQSDFSRTPLLARGWRWPAAFSGMSALAATLLVMLVSRPPRVVERVVRVPMPAAVVSDSQPQSPSPIAPPMVTTPPADEYIAKKSPRSAIEAERQHSPPAYLDLRDRVLALGIETWTDSASEGGESRPPETYRELLKDALRGG